MFSSVVARYDPDVRLQPWRLQQRRAAHSGGGGGNGGWRQFRENLCSTAAVQSSGGAQQQQRRGGGGGGGGGDPDVCWGGPLFARLAPHAASATLMSGTVDGCSVAGRAPTKYVQSVSPGSTAHRQPPYARRFNPPYMLCSWGMTLIYARAQGGRRGGCLLEIVR